MTSSFGWQMTHSPPSRSCIQCQVCQHRIEIDRSSSATKGIVAVKIEPISANEGCTRLWKSEIHFDGIFEGLGVQPHKVKFPSFADLRHRSIRGGNRLG